MATRCRRGKRGCYIKYRAREQPARAKGHLSAKGRGTSKADDANRRLSIALHQDNWTLWRGLKLLVEKVCGSFAIHVMYVQK